MAPERFPALPEGTKPRESGRSAAEDRDLRVDTALTSGDFRIA